MRRLAVAVAVGCFTFVAALVLVTSYHRDGSGVGVDLSWPICGAQAILARVDPYSTCHYLHAGQQATPYPLTAMVALIPFAPLGPLAGAFVAFAAFSGLLAFAIVLKGESWRLFMFASGGFLVSLVFVQVTPLLAAVALLPPLMPLVLLKPQLGIPILLTRFTPRRALAVAAFVMLTLILDPTWPLRWWPQTGTYDGYIPLLTLPFGPLLALSLLRRDDPRAWFLLLMALMPQRLAYDALLLLLLARNRIQLVVLSLLSWLAIVQFWPDSLQQQMVVFCYLPALAVVLLPPGEVARLYPQITAKLRPVADALYVTVKTGR